jgi:hypothetical protein
MDYDKRLAGGSQSSTCGQSYRGEIERESGMRKEERGKKKEER